MNWGLVEVLLCLSLSGLWREALTLRFHCSPPASTPQSLEGSAWQAKTAGAAPGKLVFPGLAGVPCRRHPLVFCVRQKKDPSLSLDLNLISFIIQIRSCTLLHIQEWWSSKEMVLLPGILLKGLTGAPRQLDSVISEIKEPQRGFQAEQL